MTPQPGEHNPVPRIDSFEVVEVDCDQACTDEEKGWPVVPLQVRVDSFEVTEAAAGPGPDDRLIRVTLPPDATPEDVSIVVEKLRAAVEDARTATGARILIQVHAPAT